MNLSKDPKLRTYALLLEVGGRDHDHDVQQDVWVFLEQEVHLLLDHFLELLSVTVRDAVPLLGLSPVGVVNGGEHEVLVVPAEGRVLHTNVEPGNVDPRDVVRPGELHQRVAGVREVVQIPRVVGVLDLLVVDDLLARPAEARANFLGVQIRSILDPELFALLQVHHVPVLPLQLFSRLLLAHPGFRHREGLFLTRHLLEFLEGSSLVVIVEGPCSAQLLDDLVTSQQLPVRLPVECTLWLERTWRYNLDAPIVEGLLTVDQLFNVLAWRLAELFFRRVECLHLLHLAY